MDLGWEIMIRQEDGRMVWHARPWLDDRDDDDWDGPGALTAGSAEDLDERIHRASTPPVPGARPALRLCPGCGCDGPPPGRAATGQDTPPPRHASPSQAPGPRCGT